MQHPSRRPTKQISTTDCNSPKPLQDTKKSRTSRRHHRRRRRRRSPDPTNTPVPSVAQHMPVTLYPPTPPFKTDKNCNRNKTPNQNRSSDRYPRKRTARRWKPSIVQMFQSNLSVCRCMCVLILWWQRRAGKAGWTRQCWTETQCSFSFQPSYTRHVYQWLQSLTRESYKPSCYSSLWSSHWTSERREHQNPRATLETGLQTKPRDEGKNSKGKKKQRARYGTAQDKVGKDRRYERSDNCRWPVR